MTVNTFAAISSAALDVLVGAMYGAKIIRKTTRPRIASWLIFEIGVGMSLMTYLSSRDHSLLKAALNVTDVAVVTFIVAALFVSGRGQRIAFTRNEQISLVISFITLMVWGITRTAWIGFVGFQIVMSIAYVPTIENVWRWHPGSAPEPAETWGINAVAAFLGLLVDVTGAHHDYLAALYPLRAFLSCTLVVILVQRWTRMSDRSSGSR